MEIFSRLIFSLFILGFFSNIFGYEFINIHNSTSLKTSSIYITKEKLSIQDIYTLYKENRFNPLPKNAKSFGRDKNDYWFAFDFEKIEKESYLDIKNSSLFSCTLYGLNKDGTFEVFKSQGKINQDLRIRFPLVSSDLDSLYFLKITSKSPKFITFDIGSYPQVEAHHQNQFFMFTFISGFFIFALIFYLFLSLKFQDKTYLFYIIHIIGLYISVIITTGYQDILSFFPIPFWVLLALQMQFIGLVYFTDTLLNLQNYPKIRKTIFLSMYLSIVISLIAFIYPPMYELLFVIQLFLFVLSFYIATKIALQGSLYAKYYLVGTGMALLLMSLYTLTHKGYLPYNFYTFNLLGFALLWDVVFLTFAFISKIYQIQEDNIQKEKILKLKARQDTISSMIGNITHQWRSPLSQLGSMVTTLQAKTEYSHISKNELLAYLNNMTQKLRFLSNTVDSFENFTIQGNSKTNFNLSEIILETISLVFDQKENNTMKIIQEVQKNISIQGDSNLISQVILSLLQNAKEAIQESKTTDGQIKICLKKIDKFIVFQVSDNGQRIGYDTQEKIFEPFFTTKKEGKGVGLYLAKTILEQNFDATLKLIIEKEFKTFQIEIETVKNSQSLF